MQKQVENRLTEMVISYLISTGKSVEESVAIEQANHDAHISKAMDLRAARQGVADMVSGLIEGQYPAIDERSDFEAWRITFQDFARWIREAPWLASS